jgi:hypothetical protein
MYKLLTEFTLELEGFKETLLLREKLGNLYILFPLKLICTYKYIII